ncbi:hypothetical protein HD597_000082 [Nonomuraea thailandensis]|uniref:Uncharacterized protein n=2 Tax=Nonomuraea thailandensis TaxID=1188745 RepID=A0A9X2JXG2_9ACTN|nr:hypothetical protein [Nonomuraea thailandensis]
MSDDLFGPEHRGIGVNSGGIEQRHWVYKQMLNLAEEGRLVEDPEHGGPHGQFWHTSTPIARIINASTEFRQAMQLTEEQLEDEGHDELRAALAEAEGTMKALKETAKAYSYGKGVYPRGGSGRHFLRYGPEDKVGCICGWEGPACDGVDQARAQWRLHVPSARR